MIKNLWQHVRFFCINNHDEPPELIIQQGKTAFYACPKYLPENRAADEKMCVNRLNLDDANGIVQKLCTIIEEEDNFGMSDLTNYEFFYRGLRAKVKVKILKYRNDDIRLGILNLTALKK